MFIQVSYDGCIDIRIHVTNCLLSKVAKRTRVAMTWAVLGDGYCHGVDDAGTETKACFTTCISVTEATRLRRGGPRLQQRHVKEYGEAKMSAQISQVCSSLDSFSDMFRVLESC